MTLRQSQSFDVFQRDLAGASGLLFDPFCTPSTFNQMLFEACLGIEHQNRTKLTPVFEIQKIIYVGYAGRAEVFESQFSIFEKFGTKPECPGDFRLLGPNMLRSWVRLGRLFLDVFRQ